MADDPDAAVLKACNEAEAGLSRLMGELKSVTTGIEKGTVKPEKVKAGQVKVAAFMKKFASVTKLQGSPVFARLSPARQADIMWLDEVMAELLKLQDEGRWVESAARLDPKKKPADVLKALEKAQKQWSFQGLGTLVKQAQKGIDHIKDGGAPIAFLPMAVLLFVLMMAIREKISRRPKG